MSEREPEVQAGCFRAADQENELTHSDDHSATHYCGRPAPTFPYQSTWDAEGEPTSQDPNSFSHKFHHVLESTSWVDPVVAPTVNAGLYLKEGNWTEALWGAPVFGPVLGLAKRLGRPALNGARKVKARARSGGSSWMNHPSIYELFRPDVTGPLASIIGNEGLHMATVVGIWSTISAHASVLDDNHFSGKDIFIVQRSDKLTGHFMSPMLGISKNFEIPPGKAVAFAKAMIGIAKHHGAGAKTKGLEPWVHVPDNFKNNH